MVDAKPGHDEQVMVGTPLARHDILAKAYATSRAIAHLAGFAASASKNHLGFATLLNPFATISHGCWSLTGPLMLRGSFWSGETLRQLPARAALHARSRPKMARKARLDAGGICQRARAGAALFALADPCRRCRADRCRRRRGAGVAQSHDAQSRNAAARPASSVAAVAISSGLPSDMPATTTVMPHLTKVLESVAITMAITATRDSPDLASSAMESVMASTSTRPERAATA